MGTFGENMRRIFHDPVGELKRTMSSPERISAQSKEHESHAQEPSIDRRAEFSEIEERNRQNMTARAGMDAMHRNGARQTAMAEAQGVRRVVDTAAEQARMDQLSQDISWLRQQLEQAKQRLQSYERDRVGDEKRDSARETVRDLETKLNTSMQELERLERAA